jgi:hypothetical protein
MIKVLVVVYFLASILEDIAEPHLSVLGSVTAEDPLLTQQDVVS